LPSAPIGVAGTPARPHVDREFTPLGGVASMTDPNGHIMSFTFDASGRVIETKFADGGVRRQSFDGAGRRTAFINEDGETSSFGYDGFGRLIEVSGAIGTAAYTYDEAGNLLTQTDALGRITRYRYDRLNRMIEKRYPDGAREQLAYDAAGNMTARTDANGKSTTFEYDVLGQLITKTLPGNVIVRYTYTADGRRSSTTDGRGTTMYMYDGMGRLSRVTHPSGQAIDYTHDDNGNLSTLAAGGVTVSYTYDALNRLSSMTSPEGQHRYYYDAGGNRVRTAAANGVTSDWVYDSRDRTTSLTHKSSQSSVLDSFTNLYSAAGRLTQTTQQDGSVQRYGYDALGRLNSETRTGANPYTAAYVYDAVGNRTQMTRNGATTTYTYNANDQLVSDGSATFAYDANGNLVTRTASGADTQYAYDDEDRLVGVAGSGANSQYAYDDDGNRVQATTAAGITRFLVDTANNTGLSQVLEERDGAGGLKARYAYGNDLASMTRNGVASFYLRDSNRNVRALSGTSGAVTDRYTYDGYGSAVAATGSTENPYRYSGERLDADTALYQLRARYYNPGTGRFLSRDPLPGRLEDPRTTHRYTYANSDPIMFSDPTGQESLAELSVAQEINSSLDSAELVGKTRAACTLKSTADQVEAVADIVDFAAFGLSVATSVLAVSTQFEDAGEWNNLNRQSAIKFDAPFEWKPKSARFGIDKLAVAFATSAGKVAVKGSIAFKNKEHPSLDMEVSGPPLAVKGALGFKGEKLVLQDYSVCGVKAGSLYLEAASKGYIGGADIKGKAHYGFGGSFSIDLKVSAFGDHFKVAAPLIGADFDMVKKKFTLYMLGGGFATGL
jgi:RHS repeat-associated protein